MRILRFIGKKIHGVLDFDIKFNPDLTFLTGINGSGKTTVVNCIVALTTPSLQTLANIEYSKIRVELRQSNEQTPIIIEASKADDKIEVSAGGSDKIIAFHKFVLDPTMPSTQVAEYEQEYYTNTLSTLSASEVIKIIGSIPTPMFLGLDRRARPGDDADRRRVWAVSGSRLGRKGANVSLGRSLADAAGLAELSMRDNLIAVGRVGERLRRTLILELLAMEPSRHIGFQLRPPSPSELRKVGEINKSLKDLHKVLGVSQSEVEAKLNPFIVELRNAAELISKLQPQKPKGASEIKITPTTNPEYINAIVGWNLNAPQLKRITSISQILTRYNEEITAIQSRSVTYLTLLNKFLSDSGKKVQFDESGYIFYSLSN